MYADDLKLDFALSAPAKEPQSPIALLGAQLAIQWLISVGNGIEPHESAKTLLATLPKGAKGMEESGHIQFLQALADGQWPADFPIH
ncbi:MAG: hypothetical protein N4A65_15600 [Cohaesibacter sp.]|nr:hypothetical protein [Cohaesibacter sp.]